MDYIIAISIRRTVISMWTRFASLPFLFLTACGGPAFRLQWNDLEEYGTYYPAEFRSLEGAQNGKGFSATDGTAELWADTYYLLLLDELPADFPAEVRRPFEEDGLIGATACLQGQTGPMTVSDTVTEKDGIHERRKTVAYGDAFYTVSYSYPEKNANHYQAYEEQVFGTFPVLEKGK